jgi:acetoin utilization protein AcuA
MAASSVAFGLITASAVNRMPATDRGEVTSPLAAHDTNCLLPPGAIESRLSDIDEGKALVQIERDQIEALVDPTPAVIQHSAIPPGLGMLYRYHPDAAQRLADGFLRFLHSGQGRLVVARSRSGTIVGYAVIEKPDPQERWGDPSAPPLWELGFIEVARGWRRQGIGRRLLRAAFDDRIVVATCYAWHWDLLGTRLSKSAYRDALQCFLGPEGFKPLETDEPNIREDPAKLLLARIGPLVDPQAYARFLALLRRGEGTDPARGSSLFPD